MLDQTEIRILSVKKLKELCEKHTILFRKGEASDSRYCYELIHRAILGIEEAWHAVDVQYRPWVRRVLTREFQGEVADLEDLVQETFLRFYTALTPERWEKFPTLSRVLAFLKICARNLHINYIRQVTSRTKRECALPDTEIFLLDSGDNPEQQMMTQEHEDWCKKVRVCILQKCKDDRDKQLVELRWGFELSPKEIYTRYPDQFSSRQEIYKRLRNLKDRIQRDAKCAELLNNMP